MPNIPYPDVPNAPGVPNVPRSPNAQFDGQVTQSFTQTIVQTNASKWAILDDSGRTVLQPDTYTDFQIRSEAIIPNYPVEQGGFSSYNQVDKPYNIKITAVVTGSGDLSRGQFVQSVIDLKESLNLSTIVTPDAVFSDAKLISYGWSQRSNHGLTMLMVELIFQEVRQTATAVITVAKPSGQDKKKIGQVSTIPPTAQQSSQSKSVVFKQ